MTKVTNTKVLFDQKGDAGQGVTKRCRLSWLTNSALVYEPKCGGKGGSQPMRTAVYRSSNKLWRSNSIFNLGCRGTDFWPDALDGPPGLIRPIRAVRGGGCTLHTHTGLPMSTGLSKCHEIRQSSMDAGRLAQYAG